MKYLILSLAILFFFHPILKENPKDFDYKLSNIVNAFKRGILDSDECDRKKLEVQYLIEEIDEAIKDEGEYTLDEIISLKNIKKDAQAIEEYFAVIGNCGGNDFTLENFYLANRRVGGNISNVINGVFCVDVISVTIGDYIAYLANNNSTKDNKITYKWKGNNGNNTGDGNIWLSHKSVRHIYDNRENLSLKKITVYSITCKEF